MKNYEKAYKEALAKAKETINYYKEHNRGDEASIEDLEEIFPELKESEDERIRRNIIAALRGEGYYDCDLTNECIAWLEKQGNNSNQNWKPTKEQINALEHFVRSIAESGYASPYDDNTKLLKSLINDLYKLEKQGEQKVPINDFKAKNWYVSEVDGKIHDMTYNPADKVEPKFKVRDWIINDQGSAFQIAYIDEENCRYVFEIGGYTKEEMNYENIAFANNHYRKWTIDDAKDGDVLYSLDSKQPFVFKHRKPNEQAVVYCGINTYGKFFIGNTKDCVITTDKYIPATKEQRDTLFKKMKEAGYQWDAEKKELKLLISNGGDFESNNSKQKPTWSEDDERIVTALMEGFRYHQLFNPRFGEVPNAEIISWIKSLKERLS